MFLDGIDKFDAAAFAISENEVVLMDPQQRLLLECMGEAVMQNGSPQDLSKAGVFVVRKMRNGLEEETNSLQMAMEI